MHSCLKCILYFTMITSTTYACRRAGVNCELLVWSLFGACVELVWSLCGACVELVWSLCEACVELV